MSFLDHLGSLGSFVSGVAVLISLIYLSIEIRQNTRHEKALMQLSRAGRTADIIMQTTDAGIVRAMLAGRGGDVNADPVQIEQFLRVAQAFFISFQDGFVLRQAGVLDPSTILVDDTSMKNAILPWPGYRAAWQLFRPTMHPDFGDHVDRLLREVPARAQPDRAAVWKELMANETSVTPTPAQPV